MSISELITGNNVNVIRCRLELPSLFLKEYDWVHCYIKIYNLMPECMVLYGGTDDMWVFQCINCALKITGILAKLSSYSWDAKAVIALAAFALDYGESWRLSLMQPTKQSSLQLHVFRLGSVEKPTQPTTEFKSLVLSTLQIIEKIIALEKKNNVKKY